MLWKVYDNVLTKESLRGMRCSSMSTHQHHRQVQASTRQGGLPISTWLAYLTSTQLRSLLRFLMRLTASKSDIPADEDQSMIKLCIFCHDDTVT